MGPKSKAMRQVRVHERKMTNGIDSRVAVSRSYNSNSVRRKASVERNGRTFVHDGRNLCGDQLNDHDTLPFRPALVQYRCVRCWDQESRRALNLSRCPDKERLGRGKWKYCTVRLRLRYSNTELPIVLGVAGPSVCPCGEMLYDMTLV